MGAETLPEVFNELAGAGLYDIVLPFLIVFAIVYALVYEAGLFGQKNNAVSAIIGIAFAFFTVQYFPLGEWLAGFAGNFGLLVLAVVLLGAVAVLGGNQLIDMKYIGLLGLLGLVLLFLQPEQGGEMGVLSMIYGESIEIPFLGETTFMTVFFILILIGAVYYLMKGGSQPT